MTKKRDKDTAVTVGEGPLDAAGIIAVARRGATVVLSGKPAFRKRIESSRRLLQKAIESDIPVYGVTTGFGKSCGNRLNKKNLPTNGESLMRFHGCGTGEPLGGEETRAAMFCRLLCLARAAVLWAVTAILRRPAITVPADNGLNSPSTCLKIGVEIRQRLPHADHQPNQQNKSQERRCQQRRPSYSYRLHDIVSPSS